jgi:hypothetical protein
MPEAWLGRGLLRMDSGDKDGAISDWKQALEVAPAGSPQRQKAEQYLADARSE